MVDGCSRWQTFYKIILPLVGPGLIATGVYGWILAWNEFVLANTLLLDNSKQTSMVYLLRLPVQPDARRRLRRADGRGHADRAAGRRAVRDLPEPDLGRAHRRRGEGLMHGRHRASTSAARRIKAARVAADGDRARDRVDCPTPARRRDSTAAVGRSPRRCATTTPSPSASSLPGVLDRATASCAVAANLRLARRAAARPARRRPRRCRSCSSHDVAAAALAESAQRHRRRRCSSSGSAPASARRTSSTARRARRDRAGRRARPRPGARRTASRARAGSAAASRPTRPPPRSPAATSRARRAAARRRPRSSRGSAPTRSPRGVGARPSTRSALALATDGAACSTRRGSCSAAGWPRPATRCSTRCAAALPARLTWRPAPPLVPARGSAPDAGHLGAALLAWRRSRRAARRQEGAPHDRPRPARAS